MESANRWGSFGAKGGVVPPSVFNQLLTCSDQIYFILHDLAAYLVLVTPYFWMAMNKV
jgi:hypothetical protein